MEIKSAGTFHKDFTKGLIYIKKIMPDAIETGYVAYSGKLEQEGEAFRLINFEKAHTIFNKFYIRIFA